MKKRKNGINYVVNFDKIGSSGLLLYGDVGTGKSYMAACIANALMEAKHSVRWLQTTQITEMCGFYSEEQYYAHLSDISYPDLLIIDDLGTEFTTQFSTSAIYNIFNSRLLADKPVIINTNLTLHELEKLYSQRFVSRITGQAVRLDFFGKDIRIMKK